MEFAIGRVVRADDGRVGVVVDVWPLHAPHHGVVLWEPLLAGDRTTVEPVEVVVIA